MISSGKLPFWNPGVSCNTSIYFLPFKERPRSAVEQLCLAEGSRPRMTVEEQMERIKRHQQACLREKRKGLNILGVSDQSPSQSLSHVRDNPFKLAQVGPTEIKNQRSLFETNCRVTDSKGQPSCLHIKPFLCLFWKQTVQIPIQLIRHCDVW